MQEMSLKSQLLQFLSRMPITQTVRDRKALLAYVGFGRFESKITWEGNNPAFFNELLDCLRSEGQSNLIIFLRNLVDSEWVGFDDRNRLAKFADDIQALTREQWEKEFWGYADSQTLSRVPFDLPQLDEPTFTGREAELKQLEEQLFNQSGSHVCSIVGLSGGGGIGKTTLAYHFATIHKDKFPDGVIGFNVGNVDVDGKRKTPYQIARQFVNKCLKFSGEKLGLEEEEQEAATLMQETFAHRRMLLIFDGAVDANIKQLRPGGNLCSVIITTRNRKLSASLDIPMEGTIDLDPLPEEKAYQLLEKILGAERVKAESETAYEIIRLVGCLPLALQITGKGLRDTSQSLADYRDLLQQEKTRLSLLEVWGDDKLSVTASLNLSLERLSQDQKDFFVCLSVCAEDGFARRTAAAAGSCQNEVDAQKYLNVLSGLSLLNSAQTGENRFVFHTLVRVYARNLAEESNLVAVAQERHAKFFIEWLQSNELENAEIIPQVAENLDDVILAAQWLQNQESLTEQDKKERYELILKLQPLFEKNGYYEKAIKLMKTFQSWTEESEDWNAVVKYQMHEARYLSFAEEFENAEEIIKKAAKNLKKLKSLGHSKYKERKAKLLNVLGGIFQKQGKIQEAIKAFKAQALIDVEMGNDQSLLIICIRLGTLLESQGRFEDTRLCFKKGIKVSKAINDQFRLAICLNRLGLLMYKYRSSREDAIKLLTKAAEIYKNLNSERKAAGIYIKIGGFYLGQNLLDKSLTMFLFAAELYQNIDSDAIIFGLRNLAKAFHLKRNFEQALDTVNAMLSLCLAANQKKLLTIGYHRLGLIQLSNKRIFESQEAFENEISVALDINDSSQLAIGLRSLNGLYDRFIKKSNFVDAENLLKRLIVIFHKYNAQAKVSIALNRLGKLLEEQNKLIKAQQVFEQQVLINQELQDQFQLATSLNKLGLLHKSQGNQELAIDYLERSAFLFKTLKENNRAATTYISLGGIYKNQKKLDDALRVLVLASECCEAIDCSGLIGSLRDLAKVFQKNKELDKAVQSTHTLIHVCLVTNNKKQLSIAYHRLAIIQLDNNNFLKAQQAFEDEIKIAGDINDTNQLALGLFRLVEIMKFKRKLNDIENTLTKSKEIFEKEKDFQNLIKTCSILAEILQNRKQWNKSENILQETYALAVELDDKKQQATIANNLGQVIANQEGVEKFQLAQIYFRRSIELGEELNDQPHLAKVYMAIGKMYKANEDFDQAVSELSKAFTIDENLANIGGLKVVTPELTYILTQKLRRRKEALEYCDRALKIAPNDTSLLQLKKKTQGLILKKKT